jgi:hypothetical protein
VTNAHLVILQPTPNQVTGPNVTLAYTTQTDITGLSPGPHSVQAAWVATDHLPFRNPVVAAVLFRVQ